MEERIGEIILIKDETYDVKTFRLKLNSPLDFIPGQYAVVSISGNKEFENQSRPFTFASSPTEPGFIELTVKKTGPFTAALHALPIGSRLKLAGPMGESLQFDASVRSDAVFIAGGSGITPFMSALRYASAKKLPNHLLLICSNRTEKDIIYRQELDQLGRGGNIQVVHTLSAEQPDGWTGESGRISIQIIQKYAPNLGDKIWYVCGPPPMLNAVKEMLLSAGVSKDKLKYEDWQIPGKHDEAKT